VVEALDVATHETRFSHTGKARDMTTPELPPLPDPFVTAGLPQSGVLAHGYSAKQMHAYAESARAPLVAEVDRLRAEVEKLLESLRDPNFVHTIMLRGVIAPIGWRRTCHLTGEVPNGEGRAACGNREAATRSRISSRQGRGA
jgi:hypothetical protein